MTLGMTNRAKWTEWSIKFIGIASSIFKYRKNEPLSNGNFYKLVFHGYQYEKP